MRGGEQGWGGEERGSGEVPVAQLSPLDGRWEQRHRRSEQAGVEVERREGGVCRRQGQCRCRCRCRVNLPSWCARWPIGRVNAHVA
eukprot:2098491-Prymnesium_polylepis.1